MEDSYINRLSIDDFSESITKLYVEKNLPKVEYVDFYDSKEKCGILIRLSQSVYYETIALQRRNAIQISIGLLEQAESDFLIISHLMNKELIYKKNDFYFGDIPSKLNEFGMNSTLIMINHIGIKKYMLPSDWENVQHSRIILSKSISFN